MKVCLKNFKLIKVVGPVKPKAHTFLRINIPQRQVSHFVTRRRLLADVTDRLFNEASPKPVVLLAMGGAGKTQLALEVCRQAEESSRFGLVMWINASSPKSVLQSYKIIAQKILKHQSHGLDAEGTIHLQVQDALQNRDRLWLMIFDNYDNPQAFPIHSIRDYVPSGKNGRILFTSRHQDTARLGHKIDASTMTEQESLELLLQRPPRDEDESIHGRRIASKLGYLALALDQASAYIRARSLDLKEFIRHYDNRKEIVLQEIPDEWEYSRAIDDEEKETRLRIFTTWELSFKQISGSEHEVENKEHFLTLAAFFDAGNISERYFQTYFEKSKPNWMKILSSSDEWDSDKLGDILSEFQKLSLLQTRNQADEGYSISIHPVISDWIKLRKHPGVQHEFATEMTIALTDYLKEIDIDLLSLETRLETARHMDSCILSDKRLSQSSSQVLDSLPYSLYLFADFYQEQGRYNEAEVLCKRALVADKEKLGVSDDATLQDMNTLAIIYSKQSQYNKAESVYKQTLVELEKKLGEMQSETLMVVENLGVCYKEQGRYEEAERLLERALKANERDLGSTDIRTLQSVNNLANVYTTQGRYDEAEILYKRALSGYQEKLGEPNLNTLSLMANLATVYKQQSRYDEAEPLYERALSGRQEKLGETHPQTLRTISNLALLYSKQGRHAEAKEVYERVLTGRMEILGARHPETLVTMSNLAVSYSQQDQYDEAQELFQRALAGRIETLGETHSDTLGTMNNLEK